MPPYVHNGGVYASQHASLCVYLRVYIARYTYQGILQVYIPGYASLGVYTGVYTRVIASQGVYMSLRYPGMPPCVGNPLRYPGMPPCVYPRVRVNVSNVPPAALGPMCEG